MHNDAFKLMRYGPMPKFDLDARKVTPASYSEDEVEVVWNSRDGVTPFMIPSRDGERDLCHIDWDKDIFDPNHVPKIGDRVFVSLTHELAREMAKKHVDLFWDEPEYPLSRLYKTKEEALVEFRKQWEEYANQGEPHLIEVTQEFLDELESNRK